MVCQLCNSPLISPPILNCLKQLVDLLSAQQREHAEECSAKNREIEALRATKLATSVRSFVHEDTSNSTTALSPTLFSETSSETFQEDTYLPLGQRIVASSSPIVENDSMTQIENVPPPRSVSPVPGPSRAPPERMDIPNNDNNYNYEGWRKKPTKLSFTGMINKSVLYSGKKKQLKPLNQKTIKESFNGQPPAKTKVKTEPGIPIETICLDDVPDKKPLLNDSEDLFESPKRKSRPVKPVNNFQWGTRHQPVDFDMNLFCEQCREYYEANPPRFLTVQDRDKKIRECQKHREKKFKGHLTPEKFWQMGWGDTPEQMKTQIYEKK